MLLDTFHVTQQKKTTTFCVLLLLVLMILCWWLFGFVWMWILCVLSQLSYCVTSFVCYRPEAGEWRQAIAEWYEKLFVWSLNYPHRPPKPKTAAKQTKDHAPLHVNEPSLGVLNGLRLPQPQASGKVNKDEGVQPMKQCHKEAQKIIQLIMRDFITNWYTDLTTDTEFPEDIQKILEHIALEINVRLQDINIEEAVVEALELILPYLEVLKEAGIRRYSGIELFDVNTEVCVKQFETNPKVAHRAMKSPAQERRHCRQALDSLIQPAFPPEYARCNVASMFVRELLLANIIEPLLDLLCDPAFLYEAIPLILLKASPEKIYRQLDDIELENEKLDRTLNKGRLIINIMGSRGHTRRRFQTSSGQFGHSTGLLSPSFLSHRRGRGRDKSRTQSIAVFPYMQKTSSGVYESTSWLSQSSQNFSRPSTIEEATAEATYPPAQKLSPRHTSRDTLAHQNHMVDGANFAEDIFEEEESGTTSENAMEVEYAVVELSPIYIERHVRVFDGSNNPYIAYIFKFPKWMLSDQELTELGIMESDTHLEGMKRFSEFDKFQSVMLASPALSIYAKGLCLPEKHHLSNFVSKLPFTNAEKDTAVIIERKEGLEKYLQSVSSVESIINSDLFRQFLKSGVKSLKEANVVNPTRTKKPNRMHSFLGKVRGDNGQKAEPVPKRPLESVLSSYLNTRLPLPCHFNSPKSTRKKQTFPSTSHTAPSSPTKTADTTKRSTSRIFRDSSHGSMHSLASSGSVPNSLTRMTHSHSFHSDDLMHATTGHLEQLSSANVSDSLKIRGQGKPATEAAQDTVSTRSLHSGLDGVDVSMGSLQGWKQEEERQTLGNDSASLSSHPSPTQTPRMRRHSDIVSHTGTSLQDESPRAPVTENSTRSQGDSVVLSKVQSLVYNFLLYAHRAITWVIFIIQKGVEPFSKPNIHALIEAERRNSPLTNALFSLGSEASARNCPRLWACSQNTQLALLVLAGGGIERFLWRELKLVVSDEMNWSRALYTLRHTLWPGGTLLKSSKRKLSEAELEQLKRKAADAFKKFLPNFFPHIVGAEEYDRAVVHCLDCLRNPRLNRHFLLRVVDLTIVKIIPEITDKSFQKHLSQLRTQQPSAN